MAVPAGGHEHTPTPQGPARAAMRMDPDLVDHLLQTAVERNGTVAPGRTWRCPCCTAWGRRWEATQRYVEVEHLLS
ncbi:hypothetical protein [Nocardiopsis sp. L17-MgMaSL7]|uniref:hypothetical protein n=1 Tax=Nocardiopsis sp. L17-MgMaSL7 TaxID=1938893 RepID=UPI001F44301B|nr:hypothetical protein [Nocardiopsis sp. L17-MgMaSL7]